MTLVLKDISMCHRKKCTMFKKDFQCFATVEKKEGKN